MNTIRLWPGITAALLLVCLRLVVPALFPEADIVGIFGALACGLLIIVWWMFFSRAPWADRLIVLLVLAAGIAAAAPLLHVSIKGAGQGMLYYIYALPLACVALVIGALAGRRMPAAGRRITMATAILLACGFWTVLRTDGVTSGVIGSDFHLRWTPTAEQRLLAQAGEEPLAPVKEAAAPPPAAAPGAAPADSAAPAPAEPAIAGTPPAAAASPAVPPVIARAASPGFRGADRNSVIRGLRIETDWPAKPPVALWRRPIGPGWSSFAVQGDLIYTQEQRGEHEVASAYRLSTGEPVWRHQDAVRFYESNGGAGPRATPTWHNGRVYTHGATGIVNALDGVTGAVAWTRNASTDTGSTMPGWGFTSSPLVAGDAVIVASSGRLVAYDAATGTPRWVRATVGGSYSSPHLTTIHGVEQVLLMSGGGGATSVNPADGTVLWQHKWLDGVAIVQPAVLDDRDVLITGGDAMGGTGMRRLAVTKTPAGWSVDERWTSRGLKPYFNDFVVHNGHAFGFDGNILSCIDLAGGARKWKGGRYGNGQALLLADQDLLLVLSEEGELVLVSATPDRFTEIAKVPALDGKTWNHPVVVGDLLLVRNGQEMAAFRLPVAKPTAQVR